MNPTLALIISKNSADIEAIVAKIGIVNLLALTPHLLAIVATINAAQTPPK